MEPDGFSSHGSVPDGFRGTSALEDRQAFSRRPWPDVQVIVAADVAHHATTSVPDTSESKCP